MLQGDLEADGPWKFNDDIGSSEQPGNWMKSTASAQDYQDRFSHIPGATDFHNLLCILPLDIGLKQFMLHTSDLNNSNLPMSVFSYHHYPN